jgi:hypothetical protein
MPLRIDATADEWGVENRMVMIDVSDQAPLQEGLSGPWQFQSAGAAASPVGFRT